VDATGPNSPDLSDYLGLMRRQWWVALLVCLATVAVAAGVTQTLPREYESTTSVLVQPVGQDTNVVGGRTKGDINLDTEAQLVRSTAVALGAAALLRSGEAPDDLARGVAVEVPPNTAVLQITYTAADPMRAQAGSHAFAEAYLRNREGGAKADLDAQVAALTSKVKQLNSSLSSIANRLSGLSDSSPQRATLESQRSTTQSQLNGVNEKLNDLSTATISGGEIISDARVPTEPSKPNRTLNLAAGAMIGLLMGFAVAVARDRLDRRVRSAADVERDARVPVLAALTARTAPRFDEIVQPYATGGRTFNRLRNEVLASLRPEDRVVVVTGASRGAAATLVAANLAAALARSGGDVVLVGAHQPDTLADTAPLARLLGVAATPGLSDVLTGKVSLAEAVQRAPRLPSLHVITTGGTASAAGLLQSQALRDTLTLLRRHDAYVVIEAPSTSTSADAQSLARLADAAILAVELRRTRRPEVVDAAAQLIRVGKPLLGAVVLPRLSPPQETAGGAAHGDDDRFDDDRFAEDRIGADDLPDVHRGGRAGAPAVLGEADEPADRTDRTDGDDPDQRATGDAGDRRDPAVPARGLTPGRRRATTLEDAPKLSIRLATGEPADLSAAGLAEFDLSGTSLLRGSQPARRPAPARAEQATPDSDTAVLRKLDTDTLRELDRADGRTRAGDASGAS
jgi:capsular polysaccharide biosynthesis protein/Mrp family chromosome partitioning ATPase